MISERQKRKLLEEFTSSMQPLPSMTRREERQYDEPEEVEIATEDIDKETPESKAEPLAQDAIQPEDSGRYMDDAGDEDRRRKSFPETLDKARDIDERTRDTAKREKMWEDVKARAGIGREKAGRALQKTGMDIADFFLRRKPTMTGGSDEFNADGTPKMSKAGGRQGSINTKWLFSQYAGNPVTKNSLNMTENFKKMEYLAANPSGPSDLATVFMFMKTLDPSSTVREGEFKSASEANGAWDSLVNFGNKFTAGELFKPENRAKFINLMKGFYNAQMKLQNEVYEKYRDKMAPTIGANPTILEGLPFEFEGVTINKNRSKDEQKKEETADEYFD